MNERLREHLPGLANILSALAVCAASLLDHSHFLLPATLAPWAGGALVALGFLVIAWAAAHIRRGFYGSVYPRTDRLVTTGPYRFVRHPAYLGMTVALAGIAVGRASGLGLACVALLFLPSVAWRARLEDAALRRHFGEEWLQYAARTGAMWPRRPRAR